MTAGATIDMKFEVKVEVFLCRFCCKVIVIFDI